MIQMRDVQFRYEDMNMRFDLMVARGALLAVIGPSGSGKSTLLNLIAGFEQALSGTIEIGGQDVTHAPPEDRPVTMIFQDNNSFAHLDIWTNTALGISPRLALNAAEKARVDDALARVGLGGLARRKPTEVSGGERQRIALARALVRERPILLLDEPFTALGPGLRHEMLDLIVELKTERDLTVLLVTHTPSDARRAATHVAFVEEGRIITVLPVKQFFQSRDVPGLRDYLGLGNDN